MKLMVSHLSRTYTILKKGSYIQLMGYHDDIGVI